MFFCNSCQLLDSYASRPSPAICVGVNVCVFLCVSACVLESGNRKREWGWDWKIANACIYINTRAPSLMYVFVRVCLCACVFACAFLRGLWVDQSFWHPRQCPPERASCQIWDQRSAASVLPSLHSLWGLSQQVSTSPEALINNQIKLSWNDSWDGWQPGRTCPKEPKESYWISTLNLRCWKTSCVKHPETASFRGLNASSVSKHKQTKKH